jgi:hypothetical protein
MPLARRFLALALALLDRVHVLPGDRAPLLGLLPGLGKRHVAERAQAHLAAVAVDRDAEHPLRPAVLALVKPEAPAVRILARRGGLDLLSGEPVESAHPVPLRVHRKI